MELVQWPRLEQQQGGQNIIIDSSPYCIGRGLNSNYVIPSKLISKQHCVFAKTAEGWTLTDMSTNGTKVNDTSLKHSTHTLKEGDQIVLSADPFVYKITGIASHDASNQPHSQTVPVLGTLQPVPAIEVPPIATETTVQSTTVWDVKDSNSNSSSDETGPKKQKLEDPVQSTTSNATMQSPLDTMDDELTCSICSELFIKAVTLNCSHSFCKYCIEMWQRNKSVCPICRTHITKANLTLVLDNFISKMLEKASDDVKAERKRLLEERAKDEEKASKSSKKPKADNQAVVIDLSDQETEDEDEDDDEDDYEDDEYFGDDSDWDVDAIPGWADDLMNDDWYDSVGSGRPYYGGYGACYTCGERGHWANGCPNRNRRRN